MSLRLLFTIIAALLIGLALLSLRQQRIESIHRMTALHRTIDQHRSTLWSLHATIAERTSPAALNASAFSAFTPAVISEQLPNELYDDGAE